MGASKDNYKRRDRDMSSNSEYSDDADETLSEGSAGSDLTSNFSESSEAS